LASKWLKDNRQGRSSRRLLTSPIDGDEEHSDPVFVDTLLNIGTETKLLAEIKDIRDELNILRRVLQDQLNILPDFVERLIDEVGNKRSQEAAELKKKSKDQLKLNEEYITDLSLMDKQCEMIYVSLTHLLDLKQKQANALEARFARDQAALTARQGKTLILFTIVTIIFLPMSFIAAFFAINIQELPKENGQQSLPLQYVSKYIFGIGFGISIPLILLAFAVDDVFDMMKRGLLWIARVLHLNTEQSVTQNEIRLTRRDDEVRASVVEKRVSRDGGSRSSIYRDLSPLSDYTQHSQTHNRIMWARTT
jgi:ElaB/YqjD/DUF883 family membrane-anchored ribosome-binding protein